MSVVPLSRDSVRVHNINEAKKIKQQIRNYDDYCAWLEQFDIVTKDGIEYHTLVLPIPKELWMLL